MSEFAAVVLAGGAARRMGGTAKPALPVGGVPMLLRVLEAASEARPRIVVGPAEIASLLPADVARTMEDPPGSGPLAAIAAGVALLPDTTCDVALLAADLPFLDHSVVGDLRALVGGDMLAAVLVDDDGRPQWLCSVWRVPALRHRLAQIGDPAGHAVRELADGVPLARHAVHGPDRPPAWLDCDTIEDVRRAEEWAGGTG